MKRFILSTLAVLLCSSLSAQSSASLTIASYNIHSGIPAGHGQANYYPGASDIRNIADVLTTTGASIIALQEVRNLSEPPERLKGQALAPNIAQELAAILGMNYAFASTLDTVTGYPENRGYTEWGTRDQWTNNAAPHGEYGNAILSKFDMSSPTLIKLPRGDAEGQKKGDEPRNATRVVIPNVPGLGKTIVYGTHLQHNNGVTREAQMKEILSHAKTDMADATIFIMGDMNHFPHPGEPDILGLVKEAGFHDLAAEFAASKNTTPPPTMGEGLVKIRIDYIFCSRPLKVQDVQVLQTEVSDHFPLAITVTP